MYETPVETPEDLVERIVEAAECVRDMFVLVSLRRCANPYNVDARRVSMHLEKNIEHLM